MADDLTEPRGMRAHLESALTGAHGKLADAIDARKKAHVTDVLETFERDIAPLLAPTIELVLANPGTPEHLKELLRQVGAPEHFSSSLLIGVAVGATIAPVLGAATEPFVQSIANDAWSALPSRPLSPDLLAAAVLKTVETPAQAATEAHLSGIDAARFAVMVETAGNSLGISELLLLWRRGEITDAELDAGLAYSDLNPKFYDYAKGLKYLPPPAAEVITGALKGHLDPTVAHTMLGEAGIDPANYQWLFDTAGRPPGIQQMLELWNRGEIDQERVEQAVRQSDINTDYLDDVLKTRWYLPPVRSVIAMLRAGAIDDTRATQLLTENGVRSADIPGYIAEAHHTTAGSAKELSQAQVVAVFEARLIDRPTAEARLAALKYPPADVQLLLDYADEKRQVALQNAGARAIGSKYIAYRLTKSEAQKALAVLTIPAPAQADLFTVWDIERGANIADPSPAAIVGAFRRGLLTGADTYDRLIARGIADADIPIFVGDGFPPTKPGDAAQGVGLVLTRSPGTFV